MGDLIYLVGEETKVFEELLDLSKKGEITHMVMILRRKTGELCWRTVSNPPGSFTYLIGLAMRAIQRLNVQADEKQEWEKEF